MNNRSFTLIELLVVIVIIGILAGVIMISTSSSINKANIAKVKIFEESIANDLAANMVSRWKLDEVSGITTPDIWGANTGTLVGVDGLPQLRPSSECISGGCFKFDGTDDYINCGSNESLDITNKVTVSAWVKYTAYGNTHDSWIALKKASSWDENGYGLFFGYGNDLYFNMGSSSPVSYIRYYVSDSTTRGWMFIVGAYDGSEARLYFNGIEVGHQTPAHTLISNTQPLLIGGKNAIYPFNGEIDDVRIYDAALSHSQIKQNYIAGLNSLLSKGSISKLKYNKNLEALSQK